MGKGARGNRGQMWTREKPAFSTNQIHEGQSREWWTTKACHMHGNNNSKSCC